MRVTMNMASKSYYKNLNKNYEALMKAETQNTTYRKFEKASEDPVSSIKAYRFKQEISENTSYQSNVGALEDTVKTQESSISSIQDVVDKIKSTDYLKALNDPTAKNLSDRQTLATKIRTLQSSIVSDANVKYGGNYLFGGSGTSEAPFTVDDSGNLLYRGIDVNTGAIAAGTSTTINGVSITLGDTAGKYDGYTIKVANNASAATVVDISDANKTITVNMNLSSGSEKTNEDLLSALKTNSAFSNASMTGDTQRPVTVEQPFVDFNGARITLGDTGSTYGSYTINIQDGGAPISVAGNTITVSLDLSSATNQDLFDQIKTQFPNASMSGHSTYVISSAATVTANAALTTTASIGDVQLNLGDTTGKYNGYTIQLASGTDNVTVNDSAKTITVSMSVSSGTTAEDLLKVLKSSPDFANASMSGNLSTSVTTATTAVLSSSNLPTSMAANTVGQAGLKALANEKCYVDIGSGLTFDSDGNLNSQSAFNISVPGISVLGYGSADGTGTGMSNNLYTLMDQIADQLESSNYSYDAITPYIDQFNDQSELLSAAITTSGTNSTFLTSMESRLTDVGDNASDALDEAAYVDTIDAYQNYTTKYYGYQCALQIGTKLIESTILDYMR